MHILIECDMFSLTYNLIPATAQPLLVHLVTRLLCITSARSFNRLWAPRICTEQRHVTRSISIHIENSHRRSASTLAVLDSNFLPLALLLRQQLFPHFAFSSLSRHLHNHYHTFHSFGPISTLPITSNHHLRSHAMSNAETASTSDYRQFVKLNHCNYHEWEPHARTELMKRQPLATHATNG